jgi:hypothetical protein
MSFKVVQLIAFILRELKQTKLKGLQQISQIILDLTMPMKKIREDTDGPSATISTIDLK